MDLSGVGVISASIRVPRTGAIAGEMELDGELGTGVATFSGGLVCTVIDAVGYAGRTYVRIRGGSGGLGNDATAAHFKNAPGATVLSATLGKARELQSPLIGPDVLAKFFSFISLPAGTYAGQVSVIADVIGCDWRTTYAGLIWLGSGRPVGPPVTEPELLYVDPAGKRATYAVDSMSVQPGDVLSVGEVESVTYDFGETGRATVYIV